MRYDFAMLEKRTAESLARIDLIDRLKAAHEAAQQIPDLEAELREVLGGMGYTLGKLSPFVEPKAAVKPDMTDWRNWREGDLVLCVDGSGWECFSTGMVCCVTGFYLYGIEINKIQVRESYTDDFRFHSRPSKGVGEVFNAYAHADKERRERRAVGSDV